MNREETTAAINIMVLFSNGSIRGERDKMQRDIKNDFEPEEEGEREEADDCCA